MSEFWDTFGDGAQGALDSMGEVVVVAGNPVQAVVQPVETDPSAVPGGVSPGVSFVLQVSQEDGDVVSDGDAVMARGMTGRVVKKIHFGGGWMVHVGPENRWDGNFE